jgi:hypothetical protein
MAASEAMSGLAERIAGVESARELADRREREVGGRVRELAALAEEHDAYQRRVGAGAERDPEIERRLADALGAPGVELRTEADVPALTDRLAEAQLAGAREALEQAEQELGLYCAARLPDLTDELMAGADADRRGVLDAARRLALAIHPLNERHRRLSTVYRLAGRAGQAPDPPFEDLVRELKRTERAA